MKKKYAKNQLQEAIKSINNICTNNVGCFQEPIISSSCPTFEKATANYIQKRLNIYLQSWVLLRLDRVLNELSK